MGYPAVHGEISEDTAADRVLIPPRLRPAHAGQAIAALVVALCGVSVAAAGVAKGVYTGVAHRGGHQMDIALQVVAGARSTNWRINVTGSCSQPGVVLGVGLGTGTQPGVRPLRIRSGRFSVSHRGTMANHPDTYRYALVWHAARGGFAGTFRYVEVSNYTNPATVCDSSLLHWLAHPSSHPFP
jgi:hypothetical protein